MSCPFKNDVGKSSNIENDVRGEIESASQKADSIWADILNQKSTAVPTEPKQWPTYAEVGNDMTSSDYNRILHDHIDKRSEMYGDKMKLFGAYGYVSRIRIEWFEGHGFTGVFKSAEHGIIRLSSALQPVSGLPSFMGKISKSKIFPQVAIKVFRSGQNSANLLFGSKKIGQEENNFFEKALSTSLSEKSPIYLSWVLNIFRKYSKYPMQLGISDFAKITSDGNEEDDSEINFPWILVLVPSPESVYVNDLSFEKLESIPVGSILYDIFGCNSPSAALEPSGSGFQKLGRVITTSLVLPVDSSCNLFFKHQKKEEDYILNPHWENQLNSKHKDMGSCYCEEKN
mmetsp:Transcript_9638/g.9434  ORF Transcript_9638/g.9434 Transcript_9638/m.9434 type:complete len:343 (-) Transcript_9638:506-1534(-)